MKVIYLVLMVMLKKLGLNEVHLREVNKNAQATKTFNTQRPRCSFM